MQHQTETFLAKRVESLVRAGLAQTACNVCAHVDEHARGTTCFLPVPSPGNSCRGVRWHVALHVMQSLTFKCVSTVPCNGLDTVEAKC